MKLKRVIGIFIVTIMCALIICTFATTNTFAANSSYVLGITNVREAVDGKGGAAYGIGGLKSDHTPNKKVWKIVSYPNGGSIINYDNAFYCIKAEHGFVNNTINSDVTTVRKNYDTSFNMKTASSEVITRLNAINTAIGDTQLSQETYNKIMWIIDNMYLPKAIGASNYKQTLMQKAGITEYADGVLLTDDDIEVVQQLALWYFTNPNDSNYHSNNSEGQAILQTLLFNNWSGQDTTYKSLEDLYNDPIEDTELGRTRQYQAEDLYRYFIDNANRNGNYSAEQTVAEPITLDKTNFTVQQVGERFVIGPLKISGDINKVNVSEIGFKDQSGNVIKLTGDNQLLNSNQNVVSSGNIFDVIGQNFYISLPISTTIQSVNFVIAGNYSITNAMYYTTSSTTYLQEQPVVLVEKNTQQVNLAASVILPKVKEFDLSLRKFITAINGKELGTSREPVVDLTKLITGENTTATYNHPKTPVSVKVGDIVTYTIRVYNEGQIDGYVNEITDHLPEYLEFLPDDQDNIAGGWYYDENDTALRTIKTNHLSKDVDTDNLIKAFDGVKLSYKEVSVKCKVKSTAIPGGKITNIADITDFVNKDGNKVIDRDSQEKNVQLPDDKDLPNYKDTEINRGDKYIPGQQDDDDFEKLQIQIFDLALRKFITAVDDESITNRIPQLTIGENGNIKYTHTKEPVGVQTNNIVTYTLRIFNEGDVAGYASEITDDLPLGLQYLPENEINKTYAWKMIDKDGKETTDVTKAVKVTTDYLSKAKEKIEGENLIKAFDKQAGITNSNPDYKDIKIAFKVIEPNTSDKILTNIAQISDDTDENGNPINDIDSIPGNDNMEEDDIDIEHVKLIYFDLALRKFITKVDNLDINNRYPVLTIGEDGNIKYTHTKEPVEVENGNIVTYTLRIYNEGQIDGYASEITDNLPEGLQYLPDNEVNKAYSWKMLDKDGKETTDVTKAVKITTDYLSKAKEKTEGANLIKAFNKTAGITASNPDYKDVKVAFKVTEPNTSDRILINTAEISNDTDKNGKPIDDIDSTPNNNKNGEDDIDIEKVKVKYFDLALKKWVTQVLITENGKQTVTNTGHTGDENPEPVVKVDLKDKKLNKVTVKFAYKIKVINEGQIEGYAKEVKDYIPDGLKFVASDNPEWTKINDKEVVTNKLQNTLLKPGESATVDIILTWENSQSNLGVKVNVAEISKDYNDSNTPDIDSTPNNKKEGEDDIDDAPVILSIKTGEARIYFVLGGIILVILAGGVILIKKYVL